MDGPRSLHADPAPAVTQKSLRSSYLWVAVGILGGQTLLWVISLGVARILRPEDYGILGMALVLFSICQSLQDAGLGSALIQKRNLQLSAISSVFWLTLSLAGLFALSLFLLAPAIAQFYRNEAVTWIVRALSVNFLLVAVRLVPFALLAKEMKFGKRTAVEVSSSIVGALTTLLLAWNGYGVWSLVAGTLLSSAILTFLVYKVHPFQPETSMNMPALWPLLRFALPLTGATLLWQIYIQSDFLVIGKLLGPAALGLYTMAWNLAMATSERLTSVFNRVSFPAFSALQGKPREVGEHWIQLSEAVAWVCFPLLTGLILVAESFVVVVLGARWLPMVKMLRFLCVLALMRNLGIIMPHILNALGHSKANFLVNLVCALLLPPTLALGALWKGAEGVAACWVFLYTFIFIFLFSKASGLTTTPVRLYVSRLIPPACVVTAMAAAVIVVQELARLPGTAGLILEVGIGAIVYGTGSLWWLRRTGRLDRIIGWLRTGTFLREMRDSA